MATTQTTGRHEAWSRTPDPWAIGSWEPARLGLYDSIGITLVLTFVSFTRGFDYLTPKTSATPALSIVEAAFPLYVWGLMFMIPSVFLAVAAVARIHGGVWVGHWLLVIAYFGLFVGLGMEYFSRPWFDGSRSAITLLLPLTLHALIAFRMGWRPPRDSR